MKFVTNLKRIMTIRGISTSGLSTMIDIPYNTLYKKLKYGNFTEEGLRKQKYGELRGDIYAGRAEKVKTLDTCGDAGIG